MSLGKLRARKRGRPSRNEVMRRKVRAVRDRAGITFSHIARLANLKRATFSWWSAGQKDLTNNHLDAIDEAIAEAAQAAADVALGAAA